MAVGSDTGRDRAGANRWEDKACGSRALCEGPSMSNKLWRTINETWLWWRPSVRDTDTTRYFAVYLRVMRYARRYLFPQIVVAVGALLALSAASSVVPFLIKKVIDAI